MSVAVWTAVACIELLHRGSYFDDAFIYLAVARNIVAEGTAQLFPIASSDALVASSPLRTLLLTVGYATATAVHGSTTGIAVARCALLLTGLLTTALGCIALRRSPGRSLAACAIAGWLCLVTNSMLQMEGALIFWITFLLVREHEHRDFCWRKAALLCLLGATRPELGVAAVAGSLLLHHRSPRAFTARLATCGGCFAASWSALALALHVWPVPTTWLTKVATGHRGWFGPRFIDGAHEMFASWLPLPDGEGAGRAVLIAIAAAIGWALWPKRSGRFAAMTLLFTIALLARAPGNYAWYHENVLIAAVASLAVAATGPTGGGRAKFALAALVVAMTSQRIAHNDRLAWRIDDPDSYGSSLVALADRHVRNGLFAASTGGPERHRISTWEIGMLSYFAGPDVWLYDAAGVAQPGQIPGARDSSLGLFYPDRALRSADDELRRMRERFGDAPLRTPDGAAVPAPTTAPR
ncbi:MAG: hypothetical protein KAI24_12415 [Planctomycetes bacterium]|nr:hypothetical protein [Planctomycetota bacterium]